MAHRIDIKKRSTTVSPTLKIEKLSIDDKGNIDIQVKKPEYYKSVTPMIMFMKKRAEVKLEEEIQGVVYEWVENKIFQILSFE